MLAVVGMVCLIHGMALTGAMYYTDNYARCYERDEKMANEEYSQEELSAEFYNFRMMMYTGADVPEALVSMQASAHTNEIGQKLHRIYLAARLILWSGCILCVFAFLILRYRKRYRVLLKGVAASGLIPLVLVCVLSLVRFSAVKNVFACVLFSKYERIFYDDAAFISILPTGIFLGYFMSYLVIWLVASGVFLCVYYTKKKHRRPYEF